METECRAVEPMPELWTFERMMSARVVLFSLASQKDRASDLYFHPRAGYEAGSAEEVHPWSLH